MYEVWGIAFSCSLTEERKNIALPIVQLLQIYVVSAKYIIVWTVWYVSNCFCCLKKDKKGFPIVRLVITRRHCRIHYSKTCMMCEKLFRLLFEERKKYIAFPIVTLLQIYVVCARYITVKIVYVRNCFSCCLKKGNNYIPSPP